MIAWRQEFQYLAPFALELPPECHIPGTMTSIPCMGHLPLLDTVVQSGYDTSMLDACCFISHHSIAMEPGGSHLHGSSSIARDQFVPTYLRVWLKPWLCGWMSLPKPKYQPTHSCYDALYTRCSNSACEAGALRLRPAPLQVGARCLLLPHHRRRYCHLLTE